MQGLLGIACMVGVAWLCSAQRAKISWRIVAIALASQFLLGTIMLSFNWSAYLFDTIDGLFSMILDNVLKGSFFVFGSLAVPAGTEYAGVPSLGFLFAFQALPTIIVFSALLALLYHFGIMQRIVSLGARLFSRTLNISGVESVIASANIFVGIETVFAIRPYLRKMTPSELTLLLTLGMATVASSVLGLYILILKPVFPDIAGHLVTASLLSAPAAVLFAKILVPETDEPETMGKNIVVAQQEYDNWFASIIAGSKQGVTLCVGLAALLIAVLAISGIGDSCIQFATSGLGQLFGVNMKTTLADICSTIMYPFAWMTGIDGQHVGPLATLLGDRLLLTEAVAYQNLASQVSAGVITGEKDISIATYALCGFAHIASVAIFVGGTSALVPERANDLSRVALRALLAATLACLSTASVAGLLL